MKVLYSKLWLAILVVLAGCAPKSTEQEQQQEVPPIIKQEETTVIPEAEEQEKLPTVQIPNNRFDALIHFAQEGKSPPQDLKEWIVKTFDVDTTLFFAYSAYALTNDRLLLNIDDGGGCAATECYFGYVIALFDRQKEVLDKTKMNFVASQMGDCDLELIANSLVYGHAQRPIWDHDANEHGVPENTGEIEHKYYYYFITDEQLVDLTTVDKQTLRLARNTIYARKGYRFKSKDLQDHFAKMDWYTPKHDKTDGLLTDMEELVAQELLALEKEK